MWWPSDPQSLEFRVKPLLINWETKENAVIQFLSLVPGNESCWSWINNVHKRWCSLIIHLNCKNLKQCGSQQKTAWQKGKIATMAERKQETI